MQTVSAPCKLCKLGTKPGKIQICLPALPYDGVHFTTATYLCASCDKSYGKGIDKGLCHRLWREKNCRKVDYAGWMDQRVIRLVCSRGHDKRNSYGCIGSPGLWWVVCQWQTIGNVTHDAHSPNCTAMVMTKEGAEARMAWLLPVNVFDEGINPAPR